MQGEERKRKEERGEGRGRKEGGGKRRGGRSSVNSSPPDGRKPRTPQNSESSSLGGVVMLNRVFLDSKIVNFHDFASEVKAKHIKMKKITKSEKADLS